MNAPIKPKLTPRPAAPVETPPKQASKPAFAARLAASKVEEGETEGLNHLVTLGGLGFLAEIAQTGEHIAGASRTYVADAGTKAIDPRDQVDPRKRFIPR
ncbi:hypothetical protein [Paraburkholderia hospita]|uniref:hypothetical protein n=1 Tax=Paraburkholderia hospita TaxID=169430 RepID=UPI0008A74FC4|nr:hypothetical protein [Paraburkholderia hospita]SEI14405.1 hypothetical protein SAMN05192544_102522 [Paraburkholderia hospita]